LGKALFGSTTASTFEMQLWRIKTTSKCRGHQPISGDGVQTTILRVIVLLQDVLPGKEGGPVRRRTILALLVVSVEVKAWRCTHMVLL